MNLNLRKVALYNIEASDLRWFMERVDLDPYDLIRSVLVTNPSLSADFVRALNEGLGVSGAQQFESAQDALSALSEYGWSATSATVLGLFLEAPGVRPVITHWVEGAIKGTYLGCDEDDTAALEFYSDMYEHIFGQSMGALLDRSYYPDVELEMFDESEP